MCPMRYVSVYDRRSFGSERLHVNGAGASCDGIPVSRRSCDLELVYGGVYCLCVLAMKSWCQCDKEWSKNSDIDNHLAGMKSEWKYRSRSDSAKFVTELTLLFGFNFVEVNREGHLEFILSLVVWSALVSNWLTWDFENHRYRFCCCVIMVYLASWMNTTEIQ